MAAAITMAAGGTVARADTAADLALIKSSHPRLWVTPERLTQWRWEWQHNTPAWQQIVAWANGTDVYQFADQALCQALIYKVTGSIVQANKAITKFQSYVSGQVRLDANGYRHRGYYLPLIYDWVYDQLTSTQKTNFSNYLYWQIEDFAYGTNGYKFNRLTDTDQLTGDYMWVAFVIIATRDENPAKAAEWLEKIGGWRPDVPNTFRWALDQCVDYTRGGLWMEGTWYSASTLRYLFFGAEGIRTATGTDFFWASKPFADEAAACYLHMTAPALAGPYLWGDIEAGRQTWDQPRYRVTSAILSAVSTSSLAEQQRYYLRNVHPLMSSDPSTESKLFMAHDSQAPATDYRTVQPTDYFASGQGAAFMRSDWTTDATYGVFKIANTNRHDRPLYNLDHFQNDEMSFMVYRKGSWMSKENMTYSAGWNIDAVAHNGVLFQGLAAPSYDPHLVAYEVQPDYTLVAGSASGPSRWWFTYQPPAEYVHEYVRQFLYLKPDVFVVFDRTNSTPILDASRYHANDQPWISGAAHYKEWILHSYQQPTVTGNHIQSTNNGQTLHCQSLLPKQAGFTVVNESTLYSAAFEYQVPTVERRWQTRIWQTAETEYQAFLNVIQVTDSGVSAYPATLVATTDGGMKGTFITAADGWWVAMFCAQPGGVPPAGTIRYAYPAEAQPARNVLTGLTPGQKYTPRAISQDSDLVVELIPAADGPLAVSSQGTLRFSPVIADVDGDGHIDVIDLLYLVDSWAKTAGDPGFDPRCDMNDDGSVDVIDLLILVENWGRF